MLRLARELHHLALFAMQPEVFGWIAEAAERFADLDHPHAERVVASASTGAWQSGDLAQAHRLADLAALIAARSRWPGAGVGAPEALADLAFGRAVRIAMRDTDRYGRTVGRVFGGAQDVNAEMVRRGAAWVYRRYSDDPELLRLELVAQSQKRGLWGLPEAERMPPWEWRAAARQR